MFMFLRSLLIPLPDVDDSECLGTLEDCTGTFTLAEANALRCVTLHGNLTAEATGATTIDCTRIVVGNMRVLTSQLHACDGLVSERYWLAHMLQARSSLMCPIALLFDIPLYYIHLFGHDVPSRPLNLFVVFRTDLSVEGTLEVIDGILNLDDTDLTVVGDLILQGPQTELFAETLDFSDGNIRIYEGAGITLFIPPRTRIFTPVVDPHFLLPSSLPSRRSSNLP
jgi:hypothetical protein